LFGGRRGLSDFRKEPPWRPPSINPEADPHHTRTPGWLTRILSRAAIKVCAKRLKREAELLVARLVEQHEIRRHRRDLAEAYPLKCF